MSVVHPQDHPQPPDLTEALRPTAEVVGVDVGGTKLSAARLHEGELSEPLTWPVPRASTEATVQGIVDAVARVRTPRTQAVGVGYPSPIEWRSGRVKGATNLPLTNGLPLRTLLGERLGLPVYVDNDVACAALAEAFAHGRLVSDSLVMFTVGTGVGGGVVLGGRIYRGATGAAAEFGHTLVRIPVREPHAGAEPLDLVPDPGTTFPQPGSLESFGAGPVLDLLAARVGRDEPASLLGRLAATGRPIRGPEAVAAAQAGDPSALRALDQLGRWLGVGIANAINAFDPERVVVGGGVSAAGELVLGPARDVARRLVAPGTGLSARIVRARYGERAGVRGAALLAAQELGRAR